MTASLFDHNKFWEALAEAEEAKAKAARENPVKFSQKQLDELHAQAMKECPICIWTGGKNLIKLPF